MTAAPARITAVEKPKHKLSELTTYELRDHRHALERAIASCGSHDPGLPARTILQGRLNAVIAEQDDRARIARASSGPDTDEVRDGPQSAASDSGRAEVGDLPAIVGLLAADQLGVARDGIRDDARPRLDG
jgi:hypothetical protein